jgi:hypothetical protein
MSRYFDNASKNLFMDPKVTQYGSHMVMTDVVPPTNTKYLNIDTRYRDDYDPTKVADYNISLPERINDVKSIEVVGAEIPISFYNISSTFGNNVFNLTIVGQTAVIIIPDDQYTDTSLVSAINGQIALAGAAYSNIVYQTLNNRSTFTNTGAVDDCIIAFDVTMQGAITTQNFTYKMGWLLGYRESVYAISPSTTLISPAFIELHGPRYLYLVVDEFKNGNPFSFVSLLQESSVNSTQILARFPTNPAYYPYRTVRPYTSGDFVSDTRTYMGSVNLQRFNVRLVNERGVAMNLNGMDFSFCLAVTYG